MPQRLYAAGLCVSCLIPLLVLLHTSTTPRLHLHTPSCSGVARGLGRARCKRACSLQSVCIHSISLADAGRMSQNHLTRVQQSITLVECPVFQTIQPIMEDQTSITLTTTTAILASTTIVFHFQTTDVRSNPNTNRHVK